MLRSLIAWAAVAPLLVSTVIAQDNQPKPTQAQQAEKTLDRQAVRDQHLLLSAVNLKGASIMDESGSDVGTVERIAIHADGSLIHLISNVGGVLGLGTREIALPLSVMTVRRSDNTDSDAAWLAVNASNKLIAQAPPLEARNTLELSDSAWVRKNAAHFGLKEMPSAEKAPVLITNQLIDVKVVGQGDSATIAYLDDILISLDDKPLKYAILGYGGALGLGKEYVAIPFSDLVIERQQDEIQISVPYNSKTLSEQQRVTPSDYPELKLNSVRQRIEDDKPAAAAKP